MTTDKIQSKNINLLFGLVGALGALSIFLSYINQRKHNKIKEELLNLDKQIKVLEIQEKTNNLKK
jgi:hypothetical protein